MGSARNGSRVVFDVDGTRQAARQRALPSTPGPAPVGWRFRGWDASQVRTLLLKQTVLSNALPVFLCIPRSAVPNGMAACVSSMPPASVIAVPARDVKNVRGMERKPAKPRRVSAALWPCGTIEEVAALPPPLPASHPIVWGDWQRCFHRREVVKLLHHQRVDVKLAETASPAQSPPIQLISRAERAHYRLSWEQRLARNARPKTAPEVSIKLFGIPDAFAISLGLRIA